MEEIYAAISITAQRIMESSSSSESEEDDMLIKQLVCGKRQLKPRFKNYIPTVLNICSDMDFKSHFRMKRQTMEFLLNDIAPLLEKEQIIARMSPKKQLLIAVWIVATADSYRSICDRFDVGRATAVRTIRHVTDALFRRASTFIKWPEQAAEISAAIEQRSHFPRLS